MFADKDGEIYRLGSHFDQIPVNRPKNASVLNLTAQTSTDPTALKSINYYPSSLEQRSVDATAKLVSYRITGLVQRIKYGHPNSDFEQAADFYTKVLKGQ